MRGLAETQHARYERHTSDDRNMRIVSAASAFPQHYYSQEMLLEALQEYWGDQIENPHVLRRLHRHVSVDGRFLSLPKEEYLEMRTGSKPTITGFAPPRSWVGKP